MISSKLLIMLLPLLVVAQNTDQAPKQSVRHHKQRPMRAHAKKTSDETVKNSGEKVAKKPLGNNKHYISPYGGYGGYGYPSYGYGYPGYGYGYPSYGGYDANPWTLFKRSGESSGRSGIAKRHVSSIPHTHDSPMDSESTKRSEKADNAKKKQGSHVPSKARSDDSPMGKDRIINSALRAESAEKSDKDNHAMNSETTDEPNANKKLGNNKHFIPPYGGYGYGGYGYGGYGYGGYGYAADPRGYGYFGGWDGNAWTIEAQELEKMKVVYFASMILSIAVSADRLDQQYDEKVVRHVDGLVKAMQYEFSKAVDKKFVTSQSSDEIKAESKGNNKQWILPPYEVYDDGMYPYYGYGGFYGGMDGNPYGYGGFYGGMDGNPYTMWKRSVDSSPDDELKQSIKAEFNDRVLKPFRKDALQIVQAETESFNNLGSLEKRNGDSLSAEDLGSKRLPNLLSNAEKIGTRWYHYLKQFKSKNDKSLPLKPFKSKNDKNLPQTVRSARAARLQSELASRAAMEAKLVAEEKAEITIELEAEARAALGIQREEALKDLRLAADEYSHINSIFLDYIADVTGQNSSTQNKPINQKEDVVDRKSPAEDGQNGRVINILKRIKKRLSARVVNIKEENEVKDQRSFLKKPFFAECVYATLAVLGLGTIIYFFSGLFMQNGDEIY